MSLSDLYMAMKESLNAHFAKILAMAVEDGIITSDQRSRILSADYGSRPELGPLVGPSDQKASRERAGGITP